MRIILMSGIPGSGKSTFIEKHFPQADVCSADKFFMASGQYRFDASKLGAAHGECLRNFIHRVSCDPCETVVVDNTNLSALELAPYVAIANAFGITPELYTLNVEPAIAAARNVHGVPAAGIERMAKALAERKLPPYWNIKVYGEVQE